MYTTSNIRRREKYENLYSKEALYKEYTADQYDAKRVGDGELLKGRWGGYGIFLTDELFSLKHYKGIVALVIKKERKEDTGLYFHLIMMCGRM